MLLDLSCAVSQVRVYHFIFDEWSTKVSFFFFENYLPRSCYENTDLVILLPVQYESM